MIHCFVVVLGFFWIFSPAGVFAQQLPDTKVRVGEKVGEVSVFNVSDLNGSLLVPKSVITRTVISTDGPDAMIEQVVRNQAGRTTRRVVPSRHLYQCVPLTAVSAPGDGGCSYPTSAGGRLTISVQGVQKLGTQRVTVPAGTFDTEKFLITATFENRTGGRFAATDNPSGVYRGRFEATRWVTPEGRLVKLHYQDWSYRGFNWSDEVHELASWHLKARLEDFPVNPFAVVEGRAVLPTDINIVPPASSVDQNLAKFSGKWEGKWNDVMHHLLVVESITPDRVQVIYAYGAYEPWGSLQPNWHRVEAKYKDGRLMIELPSGATADYSYTDGKLQGNYYRRGQYHSTATMVKEH